jgi:LysM repeat protein
MNNPSPLIPQGSLLEQKNRSRSRVRVAFVFIASVHIVGLMALLTMQGCNQPPETPIDTTTTVPSFESTNTSAAGSNLTSTSVGSNTLPVEPVVQPVVQPVVPATPTGTEYIIVKGDNFYDLAKKHGVTMKAIEDANPGKDPKKLKLGDKIIIPASTTTTTTTSTGASVGTTAATGEQIYVVKSGDTLTAIAKAHSITLKELRAANNLTTDRIKVGEKLKIPVKASAPEPAPAAPTYPATSVAPATVPAVR